MDAYNSSVSTLTLINSAFKFLLSHFRQIDTFYMLELCQLGFFCFYILFYFFYIPELQQPQ